jgi:hypothetical protein
MTLRLSRPLVRKASRTTAPMRDWGPLPVESLQGSRTHRTVGWLAAAGAVVPLQGYRCPDSTKAARNHPPCATATAATQPAAASQSSIPDWSAGLGADGCRNGACVRCDARVETRRFVYSLLPRACLVKTRRTVYCRLLCCARPATRRTGGPRCALPRGGCGTAPHALVATLDAVAAREPGAPGGRSSSAAG